MRKTFRFIFNKYILILLVFIALIAFIDKNNMINIFRTQGEINRLKAEREYYLKEISDTRRTREDLMSNPKKLEKFARENYHMKKDGEEIIFIEWEKTDQKK